MNLLFDSHVLLWWHSGERRISSAVRRLVEEPGNSVAVSVATAWELTIKQVAGRIRVPEDVPLLIQIYGFASLPISLEHAMVAARLPRHHADPFDRMLIAQALVEGLTLVSHDRRLEPYGVPVVWT